MHEDFISKTLKCVWRVHISTPSIILVSEIQDSEEQEQQWDACSSIGKTVRGLIWVKECACMGAVFIKGQQLKGII